MKGKRRPVVVNIADRLSQKAKEAPQPPRSWGEEMSTELTKLSSLLKRLGAALHVLAASRHVEGVENPSLETIPDAAKSADLIPICMYCKKIRDDQDNWFFLEKYLERCSSDQFSHGICPDCFAEHFGKQE